MRHKKNNATVAECVRICAEHLEKIFIARIYAVRSTGHVRWNPDPTHITLHVHVDVGTSVATSRIIWQRPQAKSTIIIINV